MVPKRQRFVEEYLIDLNATQAAIRAGYSPKRADAIGCKLLGFTEVKNSPNFAVKKRGAVQNTAPYGGKIAGKLIKGQ
jgi:phage terminase small subunit